MFDIFNSELNNSFDKMYSATSCLHMPILKIPRLEYGCNPSKNDYGRCPHKNCLKGLTCNGNETIEQRDKRYEENKKREYLECRREFLRSWDWKIYLVKRRLGLNCKTYITDYFGNIKRVSPFDLYRFNKIISSQRKFA